MNKGKTFLKGLWIGATMTVPGVSGGTMAILTGIYEELIHSLNELKRKSMKNLLFLIEFGLGGCIGFFLFARFITMLLESKTWGTPTQFFFCGVVAGGLPVLLGKIERKGLFYKDSVFLLLGLGIIFLLGNMPKGFLLEGSGIQAGILQLGGGFLIAVALILPGISVSHMLYVLGIYESVMEKVYSFQFLGLIPLMIGGFAGTFLTADVLEKLMKQNTSKVYQVILGFVLGSVWELLPKGNVNQPVLCITVLAAGFIGMFFVSRQLKE